MNNAPEKIFKTTTYLDERKRGDVKWKDKPVAGAENIEYVRTDAFIEKAAIWFNDYFASHDVYGVIAPFNTVEEMIEDFKKYMNR